MEESMLRREDVLRLAGEINLPGDWWITSGAALVLYGVKEWTRDVDIVCTTETADRLEAEGVPFRRSPLGNTRIFAYGEQIEILENWETDGVTRLEGLPVATLSGIRKQKAALGREKDRADIRLIDEFLKKGEAI